MANAVQSLTPMQAKLLYLERKALEDAAKLAETLNQIADTLWAGCPDAPGFHAPAHILETLKDLELMVDVPIDQIRCCE